MGFLDRIFSKKTPPPSAPSELPPAPPTRPPASSPPQPIPAAPPVAAAIPPSASSPAAVTSAASIAANLLAAREKLEAKDLTAALALYESILADSGDRADVLVTISADLGSTGYVETIVELIAPRYDAERHGPATGLNLLQAYLATRNTTASRHLLDVLFALRRPELEERLHGFSNALGELIELENQGRLAPPPRPPTSSSTGPTVDGTPAPTPTGPAMISLVSVSKPIWIYGLEPLAPSLLPAKTDRVRRVAFAQLSLVGLTSIHTLMKQPEEELGRLSRALPLWFTETFCFSPLYSPIAAVGLVNEARHYALFPTEWTTENLRQLVDTSGDGLDYIFTGALRQKDGDFELLLRVWEVKKFRERKQFSARWTPATADAELLRLHEQIRLFMEWKPFPAGQGISYTPPTSPRAWLDVLGASLTLFLGEKNLLAPEQLTSTTGALDIAAQQAPTSEAATLAWLTLRAKARALGTATVSAGEAPVLRSPLTEQAIQLLGGNPS
ncbi:MAG TPA: hypothetical protein PLN52_06740 [Opitutaceae bacterium]|nr:hypothetical protein [Opitutaceae bacterium]